ncbi:GNAT family N-acetyltransferase [Nocardioides bruguierae]|uniref:GNAT family N-acetyltransferase n=1 Tax=Nocardioides bruguierae TaxID=2945102 RepID=UPI002022475B|nr:GNAT family N-acetyltransferase [Nocardioides bruguierae]MCL8024758.1 GNAT family N-acetyltransferase [Nocardioides bruguierae]
MTPSPSPRIRPARPSDLRRLAHVEDSGAEPFLALWGEDCPPALVGASPSGFDRDAAPGTLLVADAGSPPRGRSIVGFAHVLHLEGDDGYPRAHLEQLSVLLPAWGRQGIGSALVRAALTESRRDGFNELTLSTYAEVPWNGPFYARLGFAEVPEERLPAWLRRITEHERSLHLEDVGHRPDGAGRRVVMARPTAGS